MAFFKPGNYEVQFTTSALTEAKTGTPQLALNFRVINWINPETGDTEPAPESQYESFTFQALTDKTFERVFNYVREVCPDLESISQLDPGSRSPVSIAGQHGILQNVHDEYQGKIKDKWGLPREGTASTREAPKSNPAVASKLKQLFGAKEKMLTAKSRAKAPPKETAKAQQETVPATPDDEEVPF